MLWAQPFHHDRGLFLRQLQEQETFSGLTFVGQASRRVTSVWELALSSAFWWLNREQRPWLRDTLAEDTRDILWRRIKGQSRAVGHYYRGLLHHRPLRHLRLLPRHCHSQLRLRWFKYQPWPPHWAQILTRYLLQGSNGLLRIHYLAWKWIWTRLASS